MSALLSMHVCYRITKSIGVKRPNRRSCLWGSHGWGRVLILGLDCISSRQEYALEQGSKSKVIPEDSKKH